MNTFGVMIVLHTAWVCVYNMARHVKKVCVIFCLEFICYDDGCHLRKYSCNPCRKDETPTAKLLAASEIVIDKMHFSGHTDKWCLATCNPNVFSGLNNVSG